MSDDALPHVALVITRHSRDDDASRLLAHLAALPSFGCITEIIADPRWGLGAEVAGRPVRSVPVAAAALEADVVRNVSAPLVLFLAADVLPRGDVIATLLAEFDDTIHAVVGVVEATTDSPFARFIARSESSGAARSAAVQTWSVLAFRRESLASLFESVAVDGSLSLTEALWGLDARHQRHRRVAHAVVRRTGPTTPEAFYAAAFETGVRQARIARNQSGWAPAHAARQIEFYKHASLGGAAKLAKSKATAIQKGVRSGFTPLAVDGGVALFHEAAMRAGQLSVTARPGARRDLLMAPDYRFSNPYQALLYRRLPSAGIGVEGCKRLSRRLLLQHSLHTRYLHIHWLAGLADMESEASVDEGIELLRFAKQLGFVVLWTVHNETAHDTQHPHLDERMRAALASAADRIIVHERGSVARLAAKYGVSAERIAYMPHGTYAGVYTPSRDDGRGLRKRLGIPNGAFCLGLVGQIRGYKGFLEFVEAFLQHADPSWHLLVAGKPNDAELADALESFGLAHRNFHLRLGRIPNEALTTYVAASDAIVLPFRKILNSGSAILATTLARPIVAPAAGALPEMYSAYPSLATLYDPELPLGELIPTLRALTQRHAAVRAQEHHAFLEEYSWDQIGDTFIRECLRVP